MTDTEEHTTNRPTGSDPDAPTSVSVDRKIHQITFERDDIEIPDDIDLPEEREVPLIGSKLPKKVALSDIDVSLGREEAAPEVVSAADDASPMDADAESGASAEADSDEDAPKHAKHGTSADASQATEDADEASDDDDAGSVEEHSRHGKHSSQADDAKEDAQASTDAEDGKEAEPSPDPDDEAEGAGPGIEGDHDAAKGASKGAAHAKEFEIKERFFERHPKAKKRILITTASVLGAVAAVYLIGVALFSFVMYPNSNIDSIDTSIKTPVPIQEELTALIDDYSITVRGDGMNSKFTSKDAGITVDSERVAQDALKSQNPWIWPYEVFLAHDNSRFLREAIQVHSLDDKLVAAVDEINADAVYPTNAFIQFVPEQSTFIIVPEVGGTILDPLKVIDLTVEGILNLDKSVNLGEDALVAPTILQDDENLLAALEEAIAILSINPTLNLDGTDVYTIDASVIGPWVTVGEDFAVVFDPEAMDAWAQEISSSFNTVGTTRTYTRPDGKVVTVKGGTYGWKVDTTNLLTLVNDAFASKAPAVIEMPVTQSGTGYDMASGRDWGARYVDVDISEQYARFYDANGTLIWESPIVSGKSGKTDTPTGVYTLNPKAMNITLRGPMKNGEYEWESKVKYWMPFKGNSVGLHDAPWQSAFGGQRYRQGFGSHGCVNLPSGKAAELYGLIQQGDVVVVHY